MLVTGRMCFIGKLPLVLPLYKHPTVRIRGGYCLFTAPAAAAAFVTLVVILAFFYRLFAQLLPLLVYLLPKLLRVYFRRFGDLLLLEFLLVRTRLDVCAVYEDYTWIHHTVIQRFVENMFKNLVWQLLREPFAEGIAYRCKVWDLLQKPISQKPPVCQIHLHFPVGLPQRGDSKQMLQQYHFDQHDRVRPGTAIGMAIVPLQPLIQPVVIHDLLDLTQQMILRHQHIQIHDHRFPPRVFSPLLHTKHPRFLYYTGIGGVWTSFLTG